MGERRETTEVPGAPPEGGFDFGRNWQDYSQHVLDESRLTEAGKSLTELLGADGVKGVFFQVEFKVYLKEQIDQEKTPLLLSVVKEDDREKPFLRQVFRVHNPYPALKYGEKVAATSALVPAEKK